MPIRLDLGQTEERSNTAAAHYWSYFCPKNYAFGLLMSTLSSLGGGGGGGADRTGDWRTGSKYSKSRQNCHHGKCIKAANENEKCTPCDFLIL